MRANYIPVIDRIAAAMNGVSGKIRHRLQRQRADPQRPFRLQLGAAAGARRSGQRPLAKHLAKQRVRPRAAAKAPPSPNDNKVNRALNRRVEITLLVARKIPGGNQRLAARNRVMLSTLFSIISRLLWGFVGITALAFIIWMIGPLVAIATIAAGRNSTESPSALST